MPRGKKFEAGKLGETLEALDSVARKPKESINLKELIKGLKPKIKRLRIWGYNWAEIVELLGQQGIEISSDTLKEYMKTPRRKKDKPTTKEASNAASIPPKNGKQTRRKADGLNEVKLDRPNKAHAKPLKEVDTHQLSEDNTNTLDKGDAGTLNEGNTGTLNQVDANTLNEIDVNKFRESDADNLNEHDDELTIDKEVEPESSGYQPIKLTMRK